MPPNWNENGDEVELANGYGIAVYPRAGERRGGGLKMASRCARPWRRRFRGDTGTRGRSAGLSTENLRSRTRRDRSESAGLGERTRVRCASDSVAVAGLLASVSHPPHISDSVYRALRSGWSKQGTRVSACGDEQRVEELATRLNGSLPAANSMTIRSRLLSSRRGMTSCPPERGSTARRRTQVRSGRGGWAKSKTIR